MREIDGLGGTDALTSDINNLIIEWKIVKLPAYKTGLLEGQGKHSSPLTKRGILLNFHKMENYFNLSVMPEVLNRASSPGFKPSGFPLNTLRE
jgi:hypothetical protein